MTVTTDRGKTFDIDWMWGPVGSAGELLVHLRDPRPLSEIAADFEGCERFRRADPIEGDRDWAGYTALRAIVRDGEAVQMTLGRKD